MKHGGFDRRFLETTRGQVVALLRRGPQAVDELARALGVTDNGVRIHLAALERDGLVRRSGLRRGAGAGKPAVLYELSPDAEALLSRAYAPVLAALVEELVARLPAAECAAVLDGLGRRLAAGAPSAPAGDLDARLGAALAVLDGLGGDAEVAQQDGVRVIRGWGCPLAAVVARRPEVCRVVEALLGSVVGAEIRERCQHGERPSCRFEIVAR